MNIAIIGAGALGLMFAAALSQNNNVSVFDISQNIVDAINKDGCEYLDNDKIIKSYPSAYLNGGVNKPYDLVIVLVKTNYTIDSLNANKGLIGANTYVLTLQNGLGNKDKLLKFVDEDHLIIGVTRNNAVRMSLTQSKRANHNITTLGYNEHNQEFVKKLVREFERVDFECDSSNQISRLVWSKVFLNLATNAFCATYNKSIAELFNDHELWSRCQKVITEGIKVANALGEDFNINEEINKIEQVISPIDGYPSMWQDVTNKRKTEIYSLNGEIVRLGHELGIDVSNNEEITNEILKIENNY